MITKQRKFTIGRGRSCDIALAHNSVSRHHAELNFLDNNKLMLTDCNSTCGTFLLQNDGAKKKLRQELISPFDELKFGEVRLSVRELIEAIRLKFPNFESPNNAPQQHKVQGEHLVRCVCGAVKSLENTCPECGRC